MSVSATEAMGTAGMFGPTATGTTTGATTTTSSSADKDMFLQLLVAQMKYQDPMKPTDSSQFLAQSAQFTALEKMQTVADQTAQLVTTQMAFGASSLVGRTVSWTNADGTTATGAVSGVNFATNGPVLVVGGQEVPLGQVTSVSQTASAAASDGTTDASA